MVPGCRSINFSLRRFAIPAEPFDIFSKIIFDFRRPPRFATWLSFFRATCFAALLRPLVLLGRFCRCHIFLLCLLDAARDAVTLIQTYGFLNSVANQQYLLFDFLHAFFLASGKRPSDFLRDSNDVVAYFPAVLAMLFTGQLFAKRFAIPALFFGLFCHEFTSVLGVASVIWVFHTSCLPNPFGACPLTFLFFVAVRRPCRMHIVFCFAGHLTVGASGKKVLLPRIKFPTFCRRVKLFCDVPCATIPLAVWYLFTAESFLVFRAPIHTHAHPFRIFCPDAVWSHFAVVGCCVFGTTFKVGRKKLKKVGRKKLAEVSVAKVSVCLIKKPTHLPLPSILRRNRRRPPMVYRPRTFLGVRACSLDHNHRRAR